MVGVVDHIGQYEKALCDQGTFGISMELVPGRGAFEKAQDVLIATAEQAAKGGKVHALTIPHSPGGSLTLSAEMLGAEINKLGIEPLVHLACKGKNRSELESVLYGLQRARVRNILVITGDYPASGYLGRPKPVFDLDPTTLLGLITDLNQGLEVSTPRGTTKLKPANFFPGAVASPFKALESEQMGQYYKLKKKLQAGARFVVSQLGYDARKIHELLLMVKLLGCGRIPVVGNIYLLPLAAAKLMNGNGLAGCVITNKLLAEVDQESAAPDKGKSVRLDRAAKMYALMKGMGYAGVHISGPGLQYEDLQFVVGRGEELAPNWMDFIPAFDFAQPNGWYYFGKDSKTGLNTESPVDRSRDRARATLGYRAFRVLHRAMFERQGFLFGPMRTLAKTIDGSPLEHAFTRFEYFTKEITNECMHCGDCIMFDLGYLCPSSQCPKNQRNGPCGGSFEGWCEVYPGKRQCIYVRAYPNLKNSGTEDSLGADQTPPVNYDLFQTSSWLNFFLGRGHAAKRQGILPIPPAPGAPRAGGRNRGWWQRRRG